MDQNDPPTGNGKTYSLQQPWWPGKAQLQHIDEVYSNVLRHRAANHRRVRPNAPVNRATKQRQLNAPPMTLRGREV